MGKILSLTILFLALLASTHALNLKETAPVKEESTPMITIGENNDFQIYGFSIRGLIFRFIRSGVRGYIAGYEGRFNIPAECLDTDFQEHFGDRFWDAFTTVFTFWRHTSETILNRVILLLVTVFDELMNDCGDGKILIDLFELWSRTGSVWRFGLALLLHTLYTFPVLLVWGVISIAGNLVFCYWLGGYGLGQFLNAFVNGQTYPWDQL